jgi:hypothetical protein
MSVIVISVGNRIKDRGKSVGRLSECLSIIYVMVVILERVR